MKQQGFFNFYNNDIRNSNLHPTTRCLLGIISSYCHDKKDTCFPSLKTLAADLGRCERTVQRHIVVLREIGYLSVKNRGSKSNLYTLLRKVIIEKQERAKEIGENIAKKAIGHTKKGLSSRNFKEREYDLDDLESQLTAHQRE